MDYSSKYFCSCNSVFVFLCLYLYLWAHTGDAPTPPLLTTGNQKEPFSLKRRLLLLPVASATGNGFRQLTTLSEGGTWDEVGFESICGLFLKKPAQNGQKVNEEEEVLHSLVSFWHKHKSEIFVCIQAPWPKAGIYRRRTKTRQTEKRQQAMFSADVWSGGDQGSVLHSVLLWLDVCLVQCILPLQSQQ